MKSDIIDIIFKVIIVLTTITVLSYIILKYFVNNSTYYYCQSEYQNNIITPQCLKYYKYTHFVEINGNNLNETIEDIAGYILNCYDNYYQTDLKIVVCYSIEINYTQPIPYKELYDYINDYTNFNPNYIVPEGNILKTDSIQPEYTLFVIYNNSKIYLWQ